MLEERIDDRALMRLIKKWLKAGVLDTDGKVIHPVTGTPQGGIVSPILANVYLHYALDLWFHEVVKKRCRGEACLIRYADDFVCAFQYQEDAERFYNELGQTTGKVWAGALGGKDAGHPVSSTPTVGQVPFRLPGLRVLLG